MNIREVMTSNPQCVSPGDSIQSAARIMRDCDTGAVPVVDNGRPVGMLTDRDIVIKVLADGRDPSDVKAGDLGEGKPVTIGADDSVRETLATMERAQVRRLPVIDGHRLVGIISAADIARHLSARKSGKLLQEISKPRRRWPVSQSRMMRAALCMLSPGDTHRGLLVMISRIFMGCTPRLA